jgi:hypothetical protein
MIEKKSPAVAPGRELLLKRITIVTSESSASQELLARQFLLR